MGTRGVIIFRKDGIEKGVYNHWDSYPSGLGEDVVNMIKDVDGDKVFDLMEDSSREDSDFSLSGLSEMVRKREPIYYEEYKDIFREVVNDRSLPILFNVNFGHAVPRTVLPYGAECVIDAHRQLITFG